MDFRIIAALSFIVLVTFGAAVFLCLAYCALGIYLFCDYAICAKKEGHWRLNAPPEENV